MEHDTDYEIPVYTRDHHSYYKQVYEWHINKENYHNKEQLRAYHLDRAKHFRSWMVETGKITLGKTTPAAPRSKAAFASAEAEANTAPDEKTLEFEMMT